jgi:hypothetical protein
MGCVGIIRYRFWKAAQSLRARWPAFLKVRQDPAQDCDWEINYPLFGRLQMRKRDPDGRWIYRDLTEHEADEYMKGEAW